ncbi:hypothetical protein CERSUDRAFT_123491 [Gelatoporia subvermispora B]|uniref:Dirigent protein n=1 Tax=Ceriporiopsis subvermispora (strain B) TaxID=914234 RepID=M2QZF2_CERS8|nr:hypothetical protein CERSUDRAFT_123491 [Gelatoporia subvermispora B]
MFFTLTLTTLAHIALLFQTVVGAPGPAPAPTLEPLFFGTLSVDLVNLIDGPLGGRVSAKITDGVLMNPNGTLAANIVPGTGIGNGILADDGIFLASIMFTVQFVADSSFAYISVQGVGEQFVQDLGYVHVETASSVWGDLNSHFIVGNVTFPKVGPSILNAYIVAEP